MRTLADFKRRLAPGVRLHIENHVRPQASRDTEVLRVQTKQFTTRGWKDDGSEVESWMTLPPAAAFEPVDANTARLLEPGGGGWKPFVTVTFLEPAAGEFD